MFLCPRCRLLSLVNLAVVYFDSCYFLFQLPSYWTVTLRIYLPRGVSHRSLNMRASPKNRRRQLVDRRQSSREVSSAPLVFTGTMIEDLIKTVKKAEGQGHKLPVSEDAKKAS